MKKIVLAADRPSLHQNVRARELWRRLGDTAEWRYLYSSRRLLRGVQRRFLMPLIIGDLANKFDLLWCWNPRHALCFPGPVIVDLDDPCFSEEEIACLNLPNVAAVVTTTRFLRRRLVKTGCKKRIHVIPSGWEGERLKTADFSGQNKTAGERLVIGCCAPFLRPQDVKLLLDGLDTIKKATHSLRVSLIGQAGPWLRQYEKTRPEVELAGYIPHQTLLPHIMRFDIALYPRTVDYGGRFSIKLIEYLACGVPIVANDVSEAFLVKESGGGVVVQEEQFASAVIELARNPGVRAQMGRKGREFASSFTWKTLARRYREEVLIPCLNNP